MRKPHYFIRPGTEGGMREPRRERILARPEGLEPPAYWFEASRSIQLSYGRAQLILSGRGLGYARIRQLADA
jgi:hypothetical protein